MKLKIIIYLLLFTMMSAFTTGCSSKNTLYYSDGRTKYEGGWKNNLENGKGKTYNDDGKLIYEGYWLNGKYHGKGRLAIDEQLFYEGEFENGEISGDGKIYILGNLVYEGKFKDGDLIEGKEYDSSKEIIYKGGFNSFLYDGYGEIFYNNKLVYSGELSKGKIKEETILFIQRNELNRIGFYEAEAINGYILYTFNNGDRSNEIEFYESMKNNLVYKGEFVSKDNNILAEGYGEVYNYNGLKDSYYKAYEGNFKEGLWHGAGKSFWDTGSIFYDTHYSEGYRNGAYIRYYSDGSLNDKGINRNGENIKSDKYNK